MSLYKREDSSHWWINLQWRGYSRIRLSTLTAKKLEARQLLATLHALRAMGRRDLLGLIADRRLNLQDVHAAYLRDPAALGYLRVEEPSPSLGPLVAEWLAWMASPSGLSPRTRRPFAPQTIRRYGSSWDQLFAELPLGRETTLADLSNGAVAAYRKARVAPGGCAGRTVNRDICAVQSLLRYCELEREMTIARPRMLKEREADGRDRWLSADEIVLVSRAAPPEWWPLYAVLIYTGLRIGEAQALRWADVQTADARISVHGLYHRLKSPASKRDVPIAGPLSAVLSEHRILVPSSAADPVFPGELGTYDKARRTWEAVCKSAGVAPCRLHDLRHTFGVHAARGGVALSRLQKLMGHSSPSMTLRYMAHQPNADFAADAARVSRSMSGEADRQADEALGITRPQLVRGA